MNNTDLDIVFLGGLFPENTESDIINNSIGSVDNAANNLQWSLVKGLDEHLTHPVNIINSLYIGSYPKRYKKPIISTYGFSHTVNASDVNVGFLNLPLIKHYARYLTLKHYLKKWAVSSGSKPKVIVAYALTSIFVELLCYVKRHNPQVITIIVVPDLPEYMDTTNSTSLLRNIFKTVSIAHIKKRLPDIDGYILLTKHMIQALNLVNKETVVLEGIISHRNEVMTVSCQDNGLKNIVYTGTLNAKYGIVNLVDAFTRIDKPNYRLILCGSGDSVPYIEKAAFLDSRIIYMGLLRRDEIAEVQSSAAVLVNPRQNNEEFTKYSFPSKLMEYLTSGIPVVAYKLDGIPDEYDSYISYVPDNSIETLKNTLIDVVEKTDTDRKHLGKLAKDWVIKEKSCRAQTAKIMSMMEKLLLTKAAESR